MGLSSQRFLFIYLASSRISFASWGRAKKVEPTNENFKYFCQKRQKKIRYFYQNFHLWGLLGRDKKEKRCIDSLNRITNLKNSYFQKKRQNLWTSNKVKVVANMIFSGKFWSVLSKLSFRYKVLASAYFAQGEISLFWL